MLEFKDPGTKPIAKTSTPGSFFRAVGGTMTVAVLYFQLGWGMGQCPFLQAHKWEGAGRCAFLEPSHG